jgi:succinate dehydrogenase / fumarate reductase iron-sulfur subunit
MRFRVYRYDPESGAKPSMRDYVLDIDPRGKMVLDALLALKEQDDSLAFRRSCREGVCGSDGVNINGINALACVTPLAGLREPVEIRPLPRLPVVRDLIVDMSQFYRHYRAVKPYLITLDPDRRSSGYKAPPSVPNSTVCTSASCAAAAPPPVRPSGGTPIGSWALQPCWPPTASLPTAATRPRRSAWTTWKIRIGCSAATAS